MSSIIETITAGAKLLETVEILYKDAGGRIITTETEPYELRPGLYICWCYLRNRKVEIVLKNIVDAVLIGKPFDPRFQVDIE